MKFLLIFSLFAVLAITGCLAVPARYPADDAEVIDVPRRGGAAGRAGSATDDDNSDVDPFFRNFDGVIDTGAGYPFLQPNPNTFSFNLGFFDSFEDILRRLRNRWWGAELPGIAGGFGGAGGIDDDADDSSNADPSSIFPALDPKNANSTHTVKFVNGHKVEVNDTVYGDNGNLFRVRVVNIRPADSDEEAESTAPKDNSGNAGADGYTVGNGAAGNDPVTSAPSAYKPPRFEPDNKRNEIEDSDERREPLEYQNNNGAASEIEVKH